MATGILIVARLGSTRLANKHLIQVAGKTFIEWLCLRFLTRFKNEVETGEVKVVICTSARPENKQFETVFASGPVSVFYGADENIPLRQFQCAEALGLEHIISIDGDDILCSAESAAEVLKHLKSGVAAVKTSGLALGMNCMGYSAPYLKQCLDKNKADAKFETGWGRMFEGTITEFNMGERDKDVRLRFTLDYEQDAAFFTNVIAHFGEKTATVTDEEIVTYVLNNEVYKLNAMVNETYWNNFNNMKQAEL